MAWRVNTCDLIGFCYDSGSYLRKHATRTGFRSLLVVGAMLSLASELAMAQSAPSSQSAVLEEVVVTAQKRDERLIDTPQSVTVVSADELAKLGAVQFRDFANTVPGLSFSNYSGNGPQISLRGVTTGFDVSPTVGIYIDDVPYGSSTTFASGAQFALDLGLFDIDRIEVLRGPQGTLYGASTMGGLIKYVTKQPSTGEFGGDVQAGVSGTQDGGTNFIVAGSLNAPVSSDLVGLRISAFESRNGGYYNNIALGQENVDRGDVYGGRIDLLFTPTEDLTIRVNGFMQNTTRTGDPTTDYTYDGQPQYGTYGQYRLIPETWDQHFKLGAATVNYNFGPASLTSVTSYQTNRTQNVLDASALYLPFLDAPPLNYTFSAVGFPADISTDRFTQELRLASHENSRLEWLIGAYYNHEKSTNDQTSILLDQAGQPAPNILYTASFPSKYEEYAAFGDLTYHLTSKLDVTGGVRYAYNDQEYTQTGSGLLGASYPTTTSDGHAVTYLADARYHFSSHSTGYIRYATGYRPGGPNFVLNDPVTGLPDAPRTFESDTLKSYEIGFKAETVDQHFGFDVDTYYIDWSNIQVVTVVDGIGVRVNAPGGATVQGAELSLMARPTNKFSASAAFAYQHAYLNDASAALGASAGERLPNVPRFTGSLLADYQVSDASWRPTVGTTVRYVSERDASFDGSLGFPQYHLPSYTAVDLRAGFFVSTVNVQLYVHNVFDEKGQLSSDTSWGSSRVALLQPRTIGVTATAHF